MSLKLDDAEQDFIDRMGLNAEADGQARITGRVWGLLIIAGRPLTSAEISSLLDISRGSVSTNIRMLEMLELVERRSKAGERETYFAICEQPYSSLVRGFAKQFGNYRRMVERACDAIDRPEARQNLKDLATFYAVLEDGHQSMLTHLEEPNRQ